MKKKILSPEALAALAAGTVLEPEARAETDDKGETTTTAGTETIESPDTVDTFSAEDKAAFAGQIETLTTEKTELASQVEALTKTVSDLESAAISVNAQIKAAADEVSEFKGIVVGQIAAMRVGLSLSAVDMTNWTAEAILREYASTTESFEKSFMAGSRVPETPAQKHEAVSVIASSHDAADYAALGFK